MKRASRFSILFAVLAASAALPASAETLFEGTMKILSVNQYCTQGPSGEYSGTASFHPNAVVGGAQRMNSTTLNMFLQSGAQSWRLRGQAFGSTYKPVESGGIGWDLYTSAIPSYVKILSQTPTAISTTTPTVSLYGDIKNFWGRAGQEQCVARFRMVGLLVTR